MSTEYDYSTIFQEAYEGASEHYRLEQRGLLKTSPDKIAASELNNLLMRSHHAIRNNGWAASAKLKYRTQLGAIKVVWKNQKGEPAKKMQTIWDEFAANPNLDGYGTLANTQDIWNSEMFESGEALTRMLVKVRKGHTIPLVLQSINSEYLDPTWSPDTPKNTRNSITFKDSKPETYHFLKKLPANPFGILGNNERVSVPADEILHIFKRGRAGEWRGIPELAPVLLPLYELDDLTDATVTKQKAAQAVAWIVKNSNPAAAMAIGTPRDTSDINDVDENGNRRKISQTGAANVQYLNKGEDLISSQGSDIGSGLDTLIKSQLHLVAQGLGLSYEVLTGDLAGISFSSLKFVINEMKARVDFIYEFYIINLGLKPLCARFKELALLYAPSGVSSAHPTFQYPYRYGIDDLKDTQADLLEVTSNFATLEEKLAERNVTFEEIVADKKKREAAGIFLEPTAQSINNKPNPNSSSV